MVYSTNVTWQGNDMLAYTSITPPAYSSTLSSSFQICSTKTTGNQMYFLSPNRQIKRAQMFIDSEEYNKYIWYDNFSQYLPTPTLTKFDYLTIRVDNNTSKQINLTTLEPITTQPTQFATYTAFAYNKILHKWFIMDRHTSSTNIPSNTETWYYKYVLNDYLITSFYKLGIYLSDQEFSTRLELYRTDSSNSSGIDASFQFEIHDEWLKWFDLDFSLPENI